MEKIGPAGSLIFVGKLEWSSWTDILVEKWSRDEILVWSYNYRLYIGRTGVYI